MGKEREINGSNRKNSKASYYVMYSRPVESPVNPAICTPEHSALCTKTERAYSPHVTQKYSLLQPKERLNKKKPKEKNTHPNASSQSMNSNATGLKSNFLRTRSQ